MDAPTLPDPYRFGKTSTGAPLLGNALNYDGVTGIGGIPFGINGKPKGGKMTTWRRRHFSEYRAHRNNLSSSNIAIHRANQRKLKGKEKQLKLNGEKQQSGKVVLFSRNNGSDTENCRTRLQRRSYHADFDAKL
jgi:hypothetical protein